MIISIVSIIISSILGYTISKIANKNDKSIYTSIFMVTIAAVAAGILTLGIHYLISLSSEERKLEGYWIAKIENETKEFDYCVIEIDYNFFNNDIHVDTDVHNRSGERIAYWDSYTTKLSNEIFTFFYIGEAIDGNAQTKATFREGSGKLKILDKHSGVGKIVAYSDSKSKQIWLKKVRHKDTKDLVINNRRNLIKYLENGVLDFNTLYVK